MATRAEQARLYNNAIAQGLSEDQALAQAGITDPGDFNFSPDGQLEPTAVGPGRRPNETIVPAGTPLYGDSDEPDDEPRFRTTPVSSQVTTTNQNTVTGGGVRTTTVTPTTYRDTAQSSALKSEADSLAAQKEARAAELRSQGKTGAEILRDPQYKTLSREAQAKEYAAQDARAVDQAGTVSTTTSPGQGEVFQQTPNSRFLTGDTAGDDAQVNAQDANRFSTSGELPRSFSAGDVTDTGGVPTQSLADIGGDTGFVPRAEPEFVPDDLSPYGEQDDPFDPDLVTEPGQDEFQNELDNLRLAEERETRDFIASQQSDTGAQEPPEVDPDTNPQVPQGVPFDDDGNLNPGFTLDGDGNPVFIGDDFIDPSLTASAEATRAAARQQATLDNARKQATLQAQRKQGNDTDWRFRISLAPQSNYLYNAVDESGQPAAGILEPLKRTNGVIFPYTPNITTAYNANYDSTSLTHSNYRSYFYQSSSVGDINIQATFTAQDTAEAEYLLAVIHFFRSVTKMFYGANDAFAGTPPPLVYCRGFGEYQFNLHPCVISQFNYNLPSDVDYIRARSKNINGTDLLVRRDRTSVPTNAFSGALARLSAAGAKKGAIPTPPPPPSLGLVNSTYVPTRIDITLILHPIQSREQVSKQFNLKQFANGDLLKGGFW